MPSSDWTTQSAGDYHFKRCVMGRKLKFTLIPRRCYVTKRIIWLESAYCITAGYRQGHQRDYLYENRWYDKNEYMVARLKDLI
jgi:hypothetical protein